MAELHSKFLDKVQKLHGFSLIYLILYNHQVSKFSFSRNTSKIFPNNRLINPARWTITKSFSWRSQHNFPSIDSRTKNIFPSPRQQSANETTIFFVVLCMLAVCWLLPMQRKEITKLELAADFTVADSLVSNMPMNLLQAFCGSKAVDDGIYFGGNWD